MKSAHKKGDRVLVEATVLKVDDGTGLYRIEDVDGCAWWWELSGNVHARPGVTVADLVRECELAAIRHDHLKNIAPCPSWDEGGKGLYEEYWKLRRAREAAQEPQYTEGQEVWVRHVVAGTRAPVDDGGVDVKYPRGLSPHRMIFHAHHDDIRPIEEGDG